MRRAATLRLLLAGAALLVAAARCCSATPRATPSSSRPRLAESVCCSPPAVPAAPEPREGPPEPSLLGSGHSVGDPKRCCGKGWGLHCCRGGACCLGDSVVPSPPSVSVPTKQPKPAGPALHGNAPWRWKDWAQWLNLMVVILIVALVSAVLVCCWRKNRLMERNPLRVPDGHILTYGSVAGPKASAPYWTQTSRWVDFSHVPVSGTHRNYPYPYYKPTSTVNYFPSQPADM